MKPSARRPAAPLLDARSTVLFAVTGMSPAIITETVWALAHEKPAVIPDRVVVVTTAAGRTTVRRELFDGGVWEQLRGALQAAGLPLAGKLRFGQTPDDLRVFTKADARGRSVELEDIRTPADNEAAADFLLDALRPFTENPDVRLVCSLAGGRKTMGALLYACLSLIGREQDRLTHVLVNEPFDDLRLRPRFYFPSIPPHDHRLPAIANRQLQIANSSAARIELADVPFVPLRALFPRELGRAPGRFTDLVRRYRAVVDELGAPPRLECSAEEKVVRVNGVAVGLPATAIGLLEFLARRARLRQPAFGKYQEAVEPFQQFLAAWGRDHDPMNYRHDGSVKNLQRTCTDQDLRKLCTAIRQSLRRAGIPAGAIAHLVPHRAHFGIRVAPDHP